jgi:hypothetical protein
MVDKMDLESVFEGPPAEEYDVEGEGSVDLVSLDENEGTQTVGLSFLVPRIYDLLEIGWEQIVDEDEVARP